MHPQNSLRARYARFLENRTVIGLPAEELRNWKRRQRRRANLMAMAVMPLVLLLRLLRPVLWVRFGCLTMHKIGHCPLEAEFYLVERAGGVQPRRAIDFFHFDRGTDGLAANTFAKHLVERNLRVHPAVEWFRLANEKLPGGEKHRIVIDLVHTLPFADTRGLMGKFPVQIRLTDEERRLGTDLLAEMGVPPGAEIICFHIRDAGYWKTRKHDINNDSDFRNASQDGFYEAMKAVAERGHYVLRLGATTSEPLPDLHPRVIDYATRFRSEFMDVYLAATCKLMVSTASGIDAVAYEFRRPMVFVNLVAYGTTYCNFSQPFIWIFKKFISRSGKVMTFDEINAASAHSFDVTDEFVQAGISVEENSPDEITAAVLEMLDLLAGRRELTPDDQRRLKLMQKHLQGVPRHAQNPPTVSRYYLEKYEHLL